ncbi:unnamed protein product [Cladocopium goreaui]|uniref:Uncharacterized protein n=1 Tax=Cladocopium goreaui TaxID=2562237 RepID=A0A9P1BFD6_9DINO|nr:unnamed protein product [Cladocopium goreaui]
MNVQNLGLPLLESRAHLARHRNTIYIALPLSPNRPLHGHLASQEWGLEELDEPQRQQTQAERDEAAPESSFNLSKPPEDLEGLEPDGESSVSEEFWVQDSQPWRPWTDTPMGWNQRDWKHQFERTRAPNIFSDTNADGIYGGDDSHDPWQMKTLPFGIPMPTTPAGRRAAARKGGAQVAAIVSAAARAADAARAAEIRMERQYKKQQCEERASKASRNPYAPRGMGLLVSSTGDAQQLLPDGQLPIGANTAKGHGKGTGKGKGPRKRGGRNRNRGNQKSLDEDEADNLQ